MLTITPMSFAQLKNAEHVSLFSNIQNAIDKSTATKLGLKEALYNAYVNAVAFEQDIVNRSQASVYTPEMKALDDDRDRLFKLIRLKLESVILESSFSPVKTYAAIIEKHLLNKYGTNITHLAYQEESAVIKGFILDVRSFLGDEAIRLIGIDGDLTSLETANQGFADQYHERVVEKAGTDSEMAKQLRLATEEQFRLLSCHVEYMANHDTTLAGAANSSLLGVINQLIYEAQLRLDQRLGNKNDGESGSDIGNVVPPVFNK